MKKRILLSILVAVAVSFTACNGKKEADTKGGKKEITIAMVNWIECIADTHLARVLLEEKGYKVNLVTADVAPVFAAVAKGDADVFMELWAPVTHRAYMDKFGDKLEIVGTIYEDGRLGLVVPKYVTIDSITEMNGVKDKFSGKIIGINPGAGIMKLTKKLIADYGLDYELVASSEAGMLASLKKAYDRKEWVAVTGWKPHTKFARYDLKILKDPKLVLGKAETISIIAAKGWSKRNPELAKFFANFKMNDDLLGSLMLAVEGKTGKEDEAVREWLKDKKNRSVVEAWFK